jgi:glycosyltransferase involved in cell wall biosynthesis
VAPLVSILLPFKNAEATLADALDSILQQSFQDWELILVENCPTDNSTEIAKAYATKDARIKLVTEPHPGIAWALNSGLKHCQGAFIARMDADDEMLPGRLEAQANYLLQNPAVGLVSGLVEFASAHAESTGYQLYVAQINSWLAREDIYNYRFVESPFAHPSVMFRKSLVENFGGYSTGSLPEDYELWLRWMASGVVMDKIPEVAIRWRDYEKRLSRNHENYAAKAFDKIRFKYMAEHLETQPDLPPIYIWGAGKLGRKKAKLLQSHGIQIAGFIDVAHKPGILHFTQLPPPGEIFIISVVSNRGRYKEIEEFLLKRGYNREKDFILGG